MGTSTVIKTEHTMITLLYFPTAMAVLDFGLPRKASEPPRHCQKPSGDCITSLSSFPFESVDVELAQTSQLGRPEESLEEKKAHSPAESTYDHRSGRLNNQKIQLGTQT